MKSHTKVTSSVTPTGFVFGYRWAVVEQDPARPAIELLRAKGYGLTRAAAERRAIAAAAHIAYMRHPRTKP